ncbi:MAG TPA: HAD family hydrolase [Salinivirgaceae bacterium]|nr:HAD family hydrolase [Salinivirgaceae bacterium]
MYKNAKIICFDADDTLWINEPIFRESEKRLHEVLKEYISESELNKELFKIETQNIELYGYGAKAFILSLIETALKVSNNRVTANQIQQILDIGKLHLNSPVTLIDGVEKVLSTLQSNYKLILATKGDLLEQERKLDKSGLAKYFHHIEIMTEKNSENYIKLLKNLDIEVDEFVMIGNSLKSDILPVVEIGGRAIYVPYEITWQHEEVIGIIDTTLFTQVEKINDVLSYFAYV